MRYEVRLLLFPADRCGDWRVCLRLLLAVRAGWAWYSGFFPSGNGCPAAHHRRHSHGWISGCDGCQKLLPEPGTKAGNLKGPSRRSLCHCRVRCLSAAVRGSLFRAASGGLSGHWRNLCDDTGPERSFGSLFPKGKKGWTGSYVCQRNRKQFL